MTENVEREERITELSDITSMTAEMMSDVYNDKNMAAEQKMRAFSMGVRNIAVVNKMELDRYKMAQQAGLKPTAIPNSLSFQAEPSE